jgi:hypothetical protein
VTSPISPIDRMLAKATLAARPYTEAELDAAELRLAARITRRVLFGALHFDDEIRSVRGEALPPRRAQIDAEAAGHLEILCRTVIEREGALQHMSAFLGRRIPHPDGARVLGCVLQLAGREDSARFWWQFAAGAGDGAAAYCLYLHHLTLGEVWEAQLWRGQAAECSGEAADAGESSESGGATTDLVLRVLGLLRGNHCCLTDVASAVLRYVPDAVHFVDEIELPLPAVDFAQRIEELTTSA